MRWLPGTGGVIPHRTGSRLALAAVVLMLSVGVSLALESSAMRVLPLPMVPAPMPSSDSGAAGSTASPAAQQPVQGDPNARYDQKPESQGLSRSQAVALLQRRYRARVVRTHLLQGPGGQALYECRLLSADGTVWTVRIDARSGAEVP